MKHFKIMKRIKIKKVFSELLFSYIIVLLIPLVMAIGFSVAAHRIYLNKSVSDAQNNLTNGRTQFEKLLEKIDSCGNYLTYDSSLLRMEELPALSDGDQNVYSILQFRKYLNYAFLDSDISGSYALLLSNGFVFNSATTVTSLEFYYQHYCKYEEMTCEDFLEASFSTSGTFFFPLQNMVKEKVTYRVLTYNYGIKNRVSSENKADAVLHVQISESTLKEMFVNALSYDSSTVYILDGNGAILAVLGGSSDYQPDISQFSSGTGYLTTSVSGESQVIFYDQSSSRNLIYAAVIPEATIFASAQQLSLISYLLMILCLIVEIILGVRFARRYSTPIHNLLNNFERMLGSDPLTKLPDRAKRSELGDLEANVSYVLDTNRSLQNAMKEQQRQSFLDYLLNGEFRENEVILQEGALAGIPLGTMIYSVASFRLNDPLKYADILAADPVGASAATPAGASSGTSTGASADASTGASPYPTAHNRSCVLAIHSVDKRCLTVLFGVREGCEEDVPAICREMLTQLRQACGEEIQGVLGQSYEEETDITFSYRQSLFCALFERRDPSAENALLRYEDVSQYNTILWYPTSLEEKLINSVKQGDTPAVKELFAQIREENLIKRHLSDGAARLLTSNLTSTLLKASSYVSMDEKMSRIIQKANQTADLPEALDLLQSYYEEMSEEISRSRDDMDEAFRVEIMAYIQANFSDPQLSMGTTAAYFHLSESYFSTFFKKLTGENFSSCLERIRVEHSRQLLKETDYSVDQIAQMVGYSNGGTFRRAFRRMTGMSPTEWKG